MELLFSYGTLQQEEVQLETFGRKLVGIKDVLEGYVLSEIEIFDEKVIAISGKKFHPILKKTNNSNDTVIGTAFELTYKEIKLSDEYEIDAYIRKEAVLRSGIRAWIYAEKVC
ncbi:gamma-glutamylcyclotransferase [Francisella sp. Scap27]|uniref:gamma-glutamylcyclotransferase family protein n=1 Tax=Francisella sp. Scap27 TaxID=2589986 RepID=UPI0015C1A24E|nr:gamma-glutamylcyclotransferase family protein [Francisella sp. Scap27]QLE78301.1 gamma-glutamylcyclotransferase [Francisella sp. Scap27]